MGIAKIVGIAALVGAAGLGSAHAADTYIANRNRTLAQFDERPNYELLITRADAGTTLMLERSMRDMHEAPDAEITVWSREQFFDLRRELRSKGIDIPRRLPVLLDKVEGKVGVYYGFTMSDTNAQMYQYSGFRPSLVDPRTDLQEILK